MKPILYLFDMDGTVTPSRNAIEQSTYDSLLSFKSQGIQLGLVSGSDLLKIKEQMRENVLELFDYVFTENGLKSYHHGQLIHSQSIVEYLGEHTYQTLVNTFLQVLSTITLPVKRGVFLELRTGMLNVCPIGRSCTQVERDEFEQFDKKHSIRTNIITKAQEILQKHNIYNITMSIGGQISIDVFPVGWNKTYCLQFVPVDTKIYFFGDRIFPGGNDWEIANDTRLKHAFKVTGPSDTISKCNELLS